MTSRPLTMLRRVVIVRTGLLGLTMQRETKTGGVAE
jgi:hypothetical protein